MRLHFARVLFMAWIVGCEREVPAPTEATATATTASSPRVAPPDEIAPDEIAPGEVAPDAAITAPPCPDDMVLVEGRFCPEVKQTCLEHTEEYARELVRRRRARERGEKVTPRPVVERCLRYAEPATCLAKERRPMRFCIDRHEWPNREGALPALLVTWGEAQASCAGVDKRLCTVDEFAFACEGERMLPYSYGFVRDPTRCRIDRPYVAPRRALMPWSDCEKSIPCQDEVARLDQRAPIGSHPGCTSPFGALDLNGNVNEWVERPGQVAPKRAGLKGGWWGPARSRCRPTVTAHDERYAGYEVGFRCCRDAAPR